jgi:hypothetical protein
VTLDQPGFLRDRRALPDQLGDIAIDCALGHAQRFGESRRRDRIPAAAQGLELARRRTERDIVLFQDDRDCS